MRQKNPVIIIIEEYRQKKCFAPYITGIPQKNYNIGINHCVQKRENNAYSSSRDNESEIPIKAE